MASKKVRSSYRNKFGNKTAFSTAGSRTYNTGFGVEDTIVPSRVSYSYSASSSGKEMLFGLLRHFPTRLLWLFEK